MNNVYATEFAAESANMRAEEAFDRRCRASAHDMFAALVAALPMIEHCYHTNPDNDGSMWDSVKEVRSIIAEIKG